MPPIVVLHLICPTGYYGAERWVIAQARHLDPQQVAIHIGATREGPGPAPQILERARAVGLSTHEIPLTHRFDLRAVDRIAGLARSLGASILHGHGYKSDLLAILARRRARAAVVSTPHGFEKATDMKLRLYLAAGRWALRRADAVAPLSSELEQILRRMGVHRSRIQLIENGVDLEEIDATTDLDAPPSQAAEVHPAEHRLVYVGRFSQLKNLSTLLDAFALLCERRGDVRLVMLGDGPERGKLERQAESSAARGRVDFLGYREDRLFLLASCDIFCMSSRYEGIPRSMMEAMALGLPAVAFSIPGVDKLVLDGTTGFGVEMNDTEAMVAAWERLLEDEALRRRLGKSAARHVRECYSASRMAREYEALYRRLSARAT